MNEEDVRLLQAAAGFGGGVNESIPTAVGDVVVEQLSVDDLSVEQINHALQSLVNTMGEEAGTEGIGQDIKHHSHHHHHHQQSPLLTPPPGPEENLSSPNSRTTNSGFGFDVNLNTAGDIGELWGIRGQNGDSVTGGGGMEDGSDIDYEVQLADLQRSLAELSHPTTRANTPPSTTPSKEQPPMSSELVLRADQDRQIITTEHNPNVAPSPDATETNGKNRGRQLSVVDPSEDPLKAAEKERIRVENRERKKKWRNQNQERNKDNDLRCRVTKRALHLYGPDMSTEKSNWIEREFNRRRSKRVTRTKSRDSDPTGSDPNAGSSSVFPAFSQSIPHLPPNFMSNSGDIVLRNQLANALNNSTNIEVNSEFVIIELVALLSTQPALLPYLADILNQMKTDARTSAMVQNCSSREAQDSSSRITDVSDHTHTENLSRNNEGNFDPHEAGIGLIGDGSNAGWTTGSVTPVPEGLEGATGDMVGFESIDKIAAGFENLVASLEKSLRDEHGVEAGQGDADETLPSQSEKGSDQVKPEPTPPKTAVSVNSSSGTVPSLDELPLDIDFGHGDIPNPDGLDQALEGLMREQYETTANEEEGEGEVQFDEEALERLITEGGIDVTEFMKSMESGSTAGAQQDQAKGIDDFTASTDMDDRRELAQQLQQAGHTPIPTTSESPRLNLEDDDLPLVATSGMTLEEINSLIADLGDGSELMPLQLDGQPTQGPQQTAPSPPPASSPPQFNPEPDTSAVYTPENVVAILKTLLEMTVIPENSPVPPPPTYNNPQRGTKRSSPDSSLNTSPTKRQRAQTPNGGASGMTAATKTAINQLNGLLLSNGYHANPTLPYGPSHHNHSSPTHHSSPTSANGNGNMQTPSYVASFGTTDGMNKRLMAMKPPPYRPAGTGATGPGMGGSGGVAGVTAKRKTGDEEKKVRAMGFPPLMAGLKPKSG